MKRCHFAIPFWLECNYSFDREASIWNQTFTAKNWVKRNCASSVVAAMYFAVWFHLIFHLMINKFIVATDELFSWFAISFALSRQTVDSRYERIVFLKRNFDLHLHIHIERISHRLNCVCLKSKRSGQSHEKKKHFSDDAQAKSNRFRMQFIFCAKCQHERASTRASKGARTFRTDGRMCTRREEAIYRLTNSEWRRRDEYFAETDIYVTARECSMPN